MKIFVCHAREERDLAEAVSIKLRQNGHEPFLADRELLPGDAYDRAIREAVASVDLALVLVSKACLTPGRYTLSEIEMLRARWRDPSDRVLSIQVADPSPHRVPPYLGNVTLGQVQGDAATDVVTLVLAALAADPPVVEPIPLLAPTYVESEAEPEEMEPADEPEAVAELEPAEARRGCLDVAAAGKWFLVAFALILALIVAIWIRVLVWGA